MAELQLKHEPTEAGDIHVEGASINSHSTDSFSTKIEKKLGVQRMFMYKDCLTGIQPIVVLLEISFWFSLF